jgi:hypothetical protein
MTLTGVRCGVNSAGNKEVVVISERFGVWVIVNERITYWEFEREMFV